MDQDEQLMAQAIDLFHRSYPQQTLQILDHLTARGRRFPNMSFLRSLCLSRMGDFGNALRFAEQELMENPANNDARQEAEALRRVLHTFNQMRDPRRTFGSSLPREVMLPLERASLRYTYKGVRLMKNPFDVALYPLLLWNLKPRTILEVGSCDGGSAIWFGDLMNTYGIDGHIHSVDVVKVTNVAHPRVTFYEGNGRDLAPTFTEEFLANCPRPWLVIEDADHSYQTSIHVCEFFHPRMHEGEYMVVEDGMSAQGPRAALAEFLNKHQSEWAVDVNYCDFYGFNVTWCVNGWLRRMGTGGATGAAAPASSATNTADITAKVDGEGAV
jgi:cephalosporin hydroxylase